MVLEEEMKKRKKMFSLGKKYRNGLLKTTHAKTMGTNVRLYQSY